MHAAPSLRGGLAARSAGLLLGLGLCACGIVSFLESRLGLPPWDVLHQGIAKHTPLSFGTANVAVSVVVVALAWSLGARLGAGTIANAILIGLFVVGLTSIDAVTGLADSGLATRSVLLAAGVLLFGVGSAFYIGAGMGAGPRDSLMLVGARRTGLRIGVVRTALELAAFGSGLALGGTIGVGTLAFALLIGPSVEASFWVLARTPLARPAVALETVGGR